MCSSDLERLVRLDGRNASFRLGLGAALAAGGELERGLGELRTGTELAPQRGDGWRKRAVVEDALLLCADASASWERAVALGEQRPQSGGSRCAESG